VSAANRPSPAPYPVFLFQRFPVLLDAEHLLFVRVGNPFSVGKVRGGTANAKPRCAHTSENMTLASLKLLPLGSSSERAALA